MLRGLDRVEFEEGGSMIDVFHRAEKRGILSLEDARRIREIRNGFVHEYSRMDLAPVFRKILEGCPILEAMIERTRQYLHETALR